VIGGPLRVVCVCYCVRMSRGRKYRRVCRNCGAPTTQRRATCSEACRVAVVHTDSRERRNCAHCGAEFSVYRTSPQQCCSRACAGAVRAALKRCPVCANPVVGNRRTCSDACARVRHEAAAAATRKSRTGVGCVARFGGSKAGAERRAYKARVSAYLCEVQGHVCAVCGGAGGKRGDGSYGLVLDHCHRTGRARAMLCARCNVAVGMVRENVAVVEGLLQYVRRINRM